MEPKKPFHEVVSARLIEQLKAGTAPFQKPWQPSSPGSHLPLNPATGRRYRGINALHLMSQDRSDRRWLTYKQAVALGGQVRKGEKGTSIQYWKFQDEQFKVDERGQPVLDGSGQQVKEVVKLERPRVFFAVVFNGEQIDGLPAIEQRQQAWNPVERAEAVLANSGASIRHVQGDSAHYSTARDEIVMPARAQFKSPESYYAVALHELGHWTGHESRLGRDLTHPFGSENYAKEELRAEIASMILGDELGIGYDPGQHAAYVASWVKVLEDDSMEIFRAAAEAEKISEYVLRLEQEQQLKQENEITMSDQSPQATPPAGASLEQPATNWTVMRPAGPPKEGDRLVDSATWWDETASAISRGAAKPSHAATEAATLILGPRPASGVPILVDRMGNRVLEEPLRSARRYIRVPYKEHQAARALGAKWDAGARLWHVPHSADIALFDKWPTVATNASPSVGANPGAPALAADSGAPLAEQRVYLAVPYADRKEARAAGADWDANANSWYAKQGADMERLRQWNPDNVAAQQAPAMDPREEFAAAMRDAGLFVGSNAQGEHPIMDGKRHRVPVDGGKKGALDGFYIGHLDGRPAGRIINNKTGVDLTWKSKGYSLSEEERAVLFAQAAQKSAEKAREIEATQNASAERISTRLQQLQDVVEPTPYLVAKGLPAFHGVRTDEAKQTTYIPAQDVTGKVWTMQFIQADGTKRFAKDSRKEGCFHIVGGTMSSLQAAPRIVIGEGYATAAQLCLTMAHATVAAFDSGNLSHVAKALRERFPDKEILIAGDDDRALALTHGKNSGRESAEAAAALVGGRAVFPVFAPGEASYPAELPAVDPVAYKHHLVAKQILEDHESGKALITTEQEVEVRKGLLAEAQVQALREMKRFTDWNDLAQSSSLGADAIARQLGNVCNQRTQPPAAEQKQTAAQSRLPEKQRGVGRRM